MPIPDFQSIMLPLMKHCADGKEHSISNSVEALAREFRLSESELRALLPSGVQEVFRNRVAWAKSHLKMAGLLANPRRGIYQITPRGREVLRQDPPAINLRLLQQFPEYVAFRSTRRERTEEQDANDSNQPLPPDESLEIAHARLREALTAELLQRLKGCSPAFFEKLVVDVIYRLGYGGNRKDAAEAIGRSRDGGIDGMIKQDKLGLDVIYIQAKRWENTVGRPEIQKFVGALTGQRAKRGLFITTSEYSSEAEEYVQRIDTKVVLIDGKTLARHMIDNNVGVSIIATYEHKKVDSDYFIED